MSKVIRHCFQQKAGRKDSESKPLEIISEQDAIEQQVAAAHVGMGQVIPTRS